LTQQLQSASAWPSIPHLRHFAWLFFLLTMEFVLVYGGADWLTAHHQMRIRAYSKLELSIPLVPAMVLPYSTMYAIFFLAPFVLRTSSDLNRLASALAKVIAISGVAFIALPAKLGFQSANADGSIWGPWLRFAEQINLEFNLIPSLHIALFATCAGVYAVRVPLAARWLLGFWLALVTASTVLTHQHHLIDAASGLVLGAWGARTALKKAAATPGVGRSCDPTRIQEVS
jgi:membrane-associated phospholipid phosphatase